LGDNTIAAGFGTAFAWAVRIRRIGLAANLQATAALASTRLLGVGIGIAVVAAVYAGWGTIGERGMVSATDRCRRCQGCRVIG